jgi:hypothetical protein
VVSYRRRFSKACKKRPCYKTEKCFNSLLDGELILHNKVGDFILKLQPAFEAFKSFEDVAVQLIDVDKDNDLDLIIGPGGNNHEINTRELQLRLFKNDG